MPEAAPGIFLDAFGGDSFRSSWRFDGFSGTAAAHRPSEVADVLAEAERTAAQGLYAVGYVSYEAAAPLNPELPSLPAREGLPLVWFAFFRQRFDVAAGAGLTASQEPVVIEPAGNLEEYVRHVEKIRGHIAAGDCYQLNYTFPLRGSFHDDPAGLYARFGTAQRAPFCACFDMGRYAILSASPELFFSLKDGVVTTRPMKGTASRGRWPAEDLEAIEQLRNSAKEKAENLMIVDLLRNDLGKIAETGSVRVDRMFAIETYPTVHQMTSTVSARLAPGLGVLDVFRAMFPCGSVTGAPKKRTMELISGYEASPRGIYCGAIGCIAPGGEATFSVAIRTLLLDRDSGLLSLGVGSGITWDSEPLQEYAECLAKSAFLRAAEEDFQLIESMRFQDASCTLLTRHLDRLGASAEYFGFAFDRANIPEALARHIRAARGALKVRLLLSRAGEIEISSEQLPAGDDAPLRVAVSELRVDSRDNLRYHKTTRRELFEKARSIRPDCDEVLFLNERGELTEGSYHTLVVKLGQHYLTPPLACGVLPGVLRAELLEKGEIGEQVLYPAILREAEELWLINSVRGWRRAMLTAPRNMGTSRNEHDHY